MTIIADGTDMSSSKQPPPTSLANPRRTRLIERPSAAPSAPSAQSSPSAQPAPPISGDATR
jgi:hypothetical protein